MRLTSSARRNLGLWGGWHHTPGVVGPVTQVKGGVEVESRGAVHGVLLPIDATQELGAGSRVRVEAQILGTTAEGGRC